MMKKNALEKWMRIWTQLLLVPHKQRFNIKKDLLGNMVLENLLPCIIGRVVMIHKVYILTYNSSLGGGIQAEQKELKRVCQ